MLCLMRLRTKLHTPERSGKCPDVNCSWYVYRCVKKQYALTLYYLFIVIGMKMFYFQHKGKIDE